MDENDVWSRLLKKFDIIRTFDPTEYKSQILQFWDTYLSGTPSGRYDWLNQGNPAGKTIWILAILNETKELIGLLTLLPKSLYQNGKCYQGAIMGDLMIHKKFRVFGPTLSMLKEAFNSMESNVLDFIYTIPNEDAKKIITRVGFRNKIDITIYQRPVIVQKFLQKRMPKLIAKILSIAIEAVMFLLCKSTYSVFKGNVIDSTEIDSAFDRFWEKKTKTTDAVISDRSSNQLKWRYQQNPDKRFRVVTYKNKKHKEFDGYLIYKRFSDKIKIYDIQSCREEDTTQLMKSVLQTARKERCQAIYFARTETMYQKESFKWYCFLPTSESMQVYWASASDFTLQHWNFMEGDRNL